MRVLFCGSPVFAVPSLAAISANHEICGVITNQDRSAGRGKHTQQTSVKKKALELGLPLFQPERIDDVFINLIKDLNPELLAVAAYGKIFKSNFLNIFSKGGINLHPSLLPKFRGPSPIPAVILAGHKQSGVTIQRLALEMDSGHILAQDRIELTGKETTAALSEQLAVIGAELFVTAIDSVEKGVVREYAQKEEEASYCKILKKDDGLIDWGKSVDMIECMIRAYNPWPQAFTNYKGLRLAILSGGVLPEERDFSRARNGEVVGVDKRYGILVKTGKGMLYIEKLQLQSKKPNDWQSFLNGQRTFIGSFLGGE